MIFLMGKWSTSFCVEEKMRFFHIGEVTDWEKHIFLEEFERRKWKLTFIWEFFEEKNEIWITDVLSGVFRLKNREYWEEYLSKYESCFRFFVKWKRKRIRILTWCLRGYEEYHFLGKLFFDKNVIYIIIYNLCDI